MSKWNIYITTKDNRYLVPHEDWLYTKIIENEGGVTFAVMGDLEKGYTHMMYSSKQLIKIIHILYHMIEKIEIEKDE